METAVETALRDLWQHSTSDRQAWLLGAGVSFNASIPLDQLPEGCHVEHVLSQIGDFIALADRSRTFSVQIMGKDVAADTLRELHTRILETIGEAVRYG